VCAGLLAASLAAAGCATRGPGGAGASPPPPAEAAASAPVDARLLRLAADFYERLEKRRFNSMATFRDPGLREYFRSSEAFSDYYAELAHELARAHFEASRPTRIVIEAAEAHGPDRVEVHVRLTGENGLPLRWWQTQLQRVETWERDASGRWWIVPGKV